MRMASYFPPLVVAGCSGAGKGTLIAKLMAWDPEAFGFSVSHTTRAPRPGEEDGVHYHFAEVDKMKAEIEQGKFLESAHVHGNYYGTSKASVEDVQKAGKICVLDIDCQGVRSVKAANLGAKCLWVEAPSMEALEARLRGRGTETEEKVQKRMANAQSEMDYARPRAGPAPFDAYLVNDDLDSAHERMKAILQTWYPHLGGGGALRKNPCAALRGGCSQS